MVEQLLEAKFSSLIKLPELKRKIAAISSVHEFKRGEIILREGQYIKVIPLLVSGLIKVYKEDETDGEVLLYYITEGESCMMSMTSLVKGETSQVKAIVEEDCEILVIPAEEALKFGKEFPDWNAFIYDLFSSKYYELLHTITTLTFSNKDTLVLEYLQTEAQIKGNNIIEKTHLQIAQDLGSTREVISRILKKLENEDSIKLAQGSIKLLSKN